MFCSVYAVFGGRHIHNMIIRETFSCQTSKLYNTVTTSNYGYQVTTDVAPIDT